MDADNLANASNIQLPANVHKKSCYEDYKDPNLNGQTSNLNTSIFVAVIY